MGDGGDSISETLVKFYQTARWNNQKTAIFNISSGRENSRINKSRIFKFCIVKILFNILSGLGDLYRP
jgi:hypothetical protein